jgi:hypothetical protein
MLNELLYPDAVFGIYRLPSVLMTDSAILSVLEKSGNISKNFSWGRIRYYILIMFPKASFSAEISSKMISPLYEQIVGSSVLLLKQVKLASTLQV